MALRTISALFLTMVSLPAFAAADLTTTHTMPSSTLVYASGSYSVTVSNIGNRDASNVTVSIQLPTTHTSPSVYVMGTVGSMSSGCSASGTKINCNLGTIRKAKSSTVTFDMALPWSAAALTFTSTAATTSSENSTANNSDSDAANITYYDLALSGDTDVVNTHCTGTGLTAWYECTLFPSSQSSHDTTLNADGSISIPLAPDYTGEWLQATPDELWFVYYDETGAQVAEFLGNAVDGTSCFEGLTTFPGSTYVSPYQVCR